MPKCVANGCFNNQEGNAAAGKVTFHRFPFHNPSLLAQWVNAVHQDGWSPRKQSCLCSDHFTPKDFERFNSGSLKVNAVPSKFKRLMSTRLKKTEKSDYIEISDKMKLKSNSGQRSEHILTKDNLESKKREINDRRSLPSKRKLENSMDELNTVPTEQSKDIQGKTMQKSNIFDEIQSSAESTVATTMTDSLPASPKSVSAQSVLKSKSESKYTFTLAGKRPVTGNTGKKRPRKIFKPSSDESEDEFQVGLSDWKPKNTDTDVQINTNEVLAAVRVELDESELSDDDDEEPEAVFEKWMRKKMEKEMGNKISPAVTNTVVSNLKYHDIDKVKISPCPVPNDMDHVVAVNERRTRYRYIYRVGQCFPEEDDDIPFIKSKLMFVINSLKSQNDKMKALQKRCRELSRSNATLEDILGIPPSTTDDEMMETDEQKPAYLIIGSHPSGSTSLPSYRFTLTDCSPTTISQSIVQ